MTDHDIGVGCSGRQQAHHQREIAIIRREYRARDTVGERHNLHRRRAASVVEGGLQRDGDVHRAFETGGQAQDAVRRGDIIADLAFEARP